LLREAVPDTGLGGRPRPPSRGRPGPCSMRPRQHRSSPSRPGRRAAPRAWSGLSDSTSWAANAPSTVRPKGGGRVGGVGAISTDHVYG
jgi:hypothetical protein